MKTLVTVKFHGQPLNFWSKRNGTHVASVAVPASVTTHFADQAAAEKAVKLCRLDETQITYHTVNK